MSQLSRLAIIAGTIVILGGAFATLPDAAPSDAVFTIPSFIFDPLSGFLQLDRYFPVATIIAIMLFDISWRIGMITVGVTSWTWRKIAGG